jgi:hypothetical protein
MRFRSNWEVKLIEDFYMKGEEMERRKGKRLRNMRGQAPVLASPFSLFIITRKTGDEISN